MTQRILIAAAITFGLVACSSIDSRQNLTSLPETSVIAESTTTVTIAESTTTEATTTTVDPRIVELEERVKELERKAAATTVAPQVGSRPAETSPQTTAKPVYLERTQVRTVSKSLPNGPWTCERTYIFSDGKRTYEKFSSPTECR